ncbi:MAG: DUF2273 domain-containing protein [Gemmatimonadetes bacterium]|nr:MAG: DUF2273 domain-containing protein [Gemmatimonadota bacterium]
MILGGTPLRGKIIGSVLGLACGISYLAFGFWDTLILFMLMGIGFFIGKFYDDRAEIFTDED